MTERLAIGGNAPPPDMFWGMHIDDLFSTLSDTLAGGAVDSDDKEAAIDAILDDFRKASKDSDKARAAEKKPHDDAGKAVQVKWKPIIDKADRGALACKEALTPYRVAKQAAANEAARIAREEAAAKAQAAQDALRKSDDLEERYQAEIQLEASRKLEAQANRIDRSATGLRTSWTAEITDKAAALRHYLNRYPDEFLALIQRLADQDARSARPDAPGITYHEHKKAA
jgi:hypothetical protein